jgi:sortase A
MAATTETAPEAEAQPPEGEVWQAPPKKQRRHFVPMGDGRSAAVWILACLLALSVWFVLYAFVLSALQESRAQTLLYDDLRENLSKATAPLGGQIALGTPLALLDAPAAGIDNVVVVEGSSSAELTEGPGHRSDTVLPGQPGVSVILGRSVMFGAPFRSIDHLKPGDPIIVTTGQGTFTYSVMDVRRPGDPLPAALPTGGSRIVLVSSSGAGWRNGWAPQQTVYVDASLTKGKVQEVPPGRPAVAPGAQQPMAGSTALLVLLVFWLQALLLVAVGVAWTRTRWGLWQTWLVAVPIVLACLWGVTQTAVVLLPNLL